MDANNPIQIKGLPGLKIDSFRAPKHGEYYIEGFDRGWERPNICRYYSEFGESRPAKKVLVCYLQEGYVFEHNPMLFGQYFGVVKEKDPPITEQVTITVYTDAQAQEVTAALRTLRKNGIYVAPIEKFKFQDDDEAEA